MDLRIRPACEDDLPAILRIYNEEILHGTATWDEEPWTLEQRQAWFAEHAPDETTPVLVAEVAGEVAGFAYLSWYRPKSGYRFTREDTVYVDRSFQGRGVGKALLGRLLEEARRLKLHAIIGVITSENEASIELHRQFGFQAVGTRREVGFKFDRWLDAVEMELVLE